jgi:hypothetical protein
MRPQIVRVVFLLNCLLPLLALGCGGSSSSSSVTAPTTVRCAVALSADTPMAAASGASGTLSVSVNRECTWQARSETEWISLASAAAGQGPATLTYLVGENPTASTRRGSITVNDQRIEISQAAAPCLFRLDGTSHAVGAAGDSHVVGVSAQAGCNWTARSDAEWVTITSGAAGSGSGAVWLAVAANPGPGRIGTVTIAGQTFTVVQAAAGQAPAPPAAGTPCTYTVRPDAHTLPAQGGTGAVLIETGANCPWSAASSAGWLTITSSPGGTGQATLTFRTEQNQGAARTATLDIAGRTVTVTQAAAPQPAPPPPPAPTPPPSPAPTCTFTVAPGSLGVGPAASTGSLSVTTTGACSWTAVSHADWISVASGASGSGNGTVQLTIAANTGTADRTGALTVAGQTVTVTQAAPAPAPPPTAPAPPPSCTFTLSTVSDSIGASASTRQLQVAASGGQCAWTASSQASWITITQGASGTGSGTVGYSATANTSAGPRTGTLTVAGQTVTVTQEGQPPPQCSYSLSRADVQAGAEGGNDSVQVSTTGQCAWTATSHATWITITQGATATGSGQARFTVAPNPSQTPRTGTLTIAGQTVTVTQAAQPAPPQCSYSLSRADVQAGAEGGSESVQVNTTGQCAWTATSHAAWITITRGASATGSDEARFTVAANPSQTPRTGTLTIAGQTVTVTQAGVADVQLAGRVADLSGSCPVLTFMVDGHTVRTTGATEFRNFCSQVRNNRRVTVTGTVQQDGAVLASRVSVTGNSDDDDDDDGDDD